MKKTSALISYTSAVLISLISFSISAFASDKPSIKFSYWNQASPPIAIREGDALSGGIIKDLGEAIGQHLKHPVEFIELPVARIEPHLRAGLIDADCITSTIWKETPDQYDWSPTLFEGADRILIRKDYKEIIEFSDMTGLRLGIYNGYVYHPQIMDMMESGKVKAFKVSDIEKGTLLLQLGRIDALIDFDVSLRYQLLTKDLKDELSLATKHADDFTLSCAYSKKSVVKKETMNNAITHLIKTGKIEAILNNYR